MKKIKKFAAIVLCMLLIISSAATVSADENTFSGIVSKTVEVSENGDVEVVIDIAGNPGIIAISLEVSYDSDVLTLKENGFTDTGLLVGNIETSLDRNPFRLSWQHSDATAVNNYQNGTIAKLHFKMRQGFNGTTDINVKVYSAQSFVDDMFVRPSDMEDGVFSITRERIAIRNGVASTKNANGETFVIASYGEESMIDCKLYQKVTGDMQITIADVLDLDGATKVKAFLWKNTKTRMPVCDCVEEKL